MHALTGLRVLDLSRVLAGPYAAQTLADLGADVIKIESPEGDDTRKWGAVIGERESTYYFCANRSKRSVCVDLTTPEGQALVRNLADKSDIVIENFKLGGVEKFGLDYETLSKRNPRLIYCSISGYGRSSPFKSRLGYDLVVQAEAGLMAINGDPRTEPVKFGIAAVDLVTGMISAQAILAAVIARQTTGRGQYIDSALFDCGLSFLAYTATASLWSGKDPVRYGNGHPDVVPYGLFECGDGSVIIAVGNDGQYRKFVTEVLERPDLADDPRFKLNRDRAANRAALFGELHGALMKLTRAEISRRMLASGVPGGQVRGVLDALNSEETKTRNMLTTRAHPTAGDVTFFNSPIKLSETPTRAPTIPPGVGEQTDEVLREILGLDDAACKKLREQGAIQ
jgi:crotonobetainyl-CoA:carnitine CoA-transferase CaiB-like acyl-CoA transferase